jgi:nucleotide-binding universal stress UspA family protein
MLDVVEERAIDMIVMATHGRGAAGRLMAGSVADRVARAASVPVMLVPASGADAEGTASTTARAKRLVVPVDGSDRARSALPIAAFLASMLEAPIHLVRVVPSRDALFASRDALETGEFYQRLVYATPVLPRPEHDDAYYEGYCVSLEDALRAEAGKLHSTGVDTTSELLIGPTAPTLLDEIHRGDVVVMTSHGEGGIRRWMLGSIAEKLVHRATAPVVLVPNAERQALIGRLSQPKEDVNHAQ